MSTNVSQRITAQVCAVIWTNSILIQNPKYAGCEDDADHRFYVRLYYVICLLQFGGFECGSDLSKLLHIRLQQFPACIMWRGGSSDTPPHELCGEPYSRDGNWLQHIGVSNHESTYRCLIFYVI